MLNMCEQTCDVPPALWNLFVDSALQQPPFWIDVQRLHTEALSQSVNQRQTGVKSNRHIESPGKSERQ